MDYNNTLFEFYGSIKDRENEINDNFDWTSILEKCEFFCQNEHNSEMFTLRKGSANISTSRKYLSFHSDSLDFQNLSPLFTLAVSNYFSVESYVIPSEKNQIRVIFVKSKGETQKDYTKIKKKSIHEEYYSMPDGKYCKIDKTNKVYYLNKDGIWKDSSIIAKSSWDLKDGKLCPFLPEYSDSFERMRAFLQYSEIIFRAESYNIYVDSDNIDKPPFYLKDFFSSLQNEYITKAVNYLSSLAIDETTVDFNDEDFDISYCSINDCISYLLYCLSLGLPNSHNNMSFYYLWKNSTIHNIINKLMGD